MRRFLLILTIPLLATNCVRKTGGGTPAPADTSEKAAMTPEDPEDKSVEQPAVIAGCPMLEPWRIRFADGSGNSTVFTMEEGKMAFVFHPVKPAHSSSGVYDGGDPKSGPVKPEIAGKLLEMIHGMASSEDLRSEHREMGTGSFSIKNARDVECHFIIRAGDELDRFTGFLKSSVHER